MMSSKRWSYQTIEVKTSLWGGFKTDAIQTELTRMGNQGWELVNIIAPSVAAPVLLVFKREQ